jgi:serpin B
MSPRPLAVVLALLVRCAPPRAPEATIAPVPAADASTPAPIASAAPSEVDAAPPSEPPAPARQGVDPAAPAVTAPLGPADHDFALRLYATQRSTPGNVFLSPASLRVALAMVYAGARGQTASQMERALGFAPDVAATSAYFASLLKEWNAGADPKIKLKVVNRVWGRKDLRFLPDFTDILSRRFAAPLERLDFGGAPDASRRKINAWVESRTEHLVRDLLLPSDVRDSTSLILTNAIYFKGAWSSPFKKASTAAGPFHVAAGKDVTAQLMHKEARFAYAESSTAKFLALPYGAGGMSMLLVLPHATFGIEEVEATLGPAALDETLAHMHPAEVVVTLPKFSSTFRTSLKSALVTMGVTDAFKPDLADFSGMAEHGLMIDDVFQKAFVKVDESGTEAAAATGAVMIPTSATIPQIFVADHPFLYAIRDRSGNILFLGRLTDPTP